MNELLEMVKAEIERLNKSPHFQLTEGWSASSHYQEDYVHGELAILIEMQSLLEKKTKP